MWNFRWMDISVYLVPTLVTHGSVSQPGHTTESVSCSIFPVKVPGTPSGALLSGVPDYFGRNEISSGGDLSDYSSASLY